MSVLLLLGLLTGCSTQGSDSSSSAAQPATGDGAAAAVETGTAATGAQAAAAPQEPEGRAPAVLRTNRALVRTAALTVRVDDVRVAAAQAVRLATGAGGGLVGEDAKDDRDELRLQVLPARLDAVLTELAGLGTERARTVGTEDVTEQVADLDSRLTTSRASVVRVRGLLQRAASVPEVVTVERELAKREAELESLQARSRALDGQVSLATVTLTLTSRVVASTDEAGFRDGLSGGVQAFSRTVRAGAVVAGALLPFVPLVLLAVAGRWLVLRRRAHARRASASPAQTS